MDNFLREFRDKVEQVGIPDAQPSDWESFKDFREGKGVRKNPVLSKKIPKKLIAGIAAAMMIGISLWAYFTSPHISGRKDIAVEATENKGSTTTTGQKMSGSGSSEEAKSAEDLFDMGQMEPGSVEINETKTLAESVSDPMFQRDIHKESGRKVIGREGNTPAKTEKRSDVEVAKPDWKTEQDLQIELASGWKNSGALPEVQDIKQSMENQPEWVENGSYGKVWIDRLPGSGLSLFHHRQNIALSNAFSVLANSSAASVQPRIRAGGSVHFIVPIEDRIGATFHSGYRIFADYAISGRFRVGFNWSKSAYTRTIPDKKLYPSLEEINPRSTDEQLEELTVDASLTKAGVFVSYDLLRFGGLKNNIGLGIQRDLSAKFEFKMQVRDKMGAQHIQHQKKNIIPRSRYFISPQYQVSYTIGDQVNLFADAQYDISLAPGRERYLSFDVGAAYIF